MRLKDKVAVITGAADGIGQAAAIRFAKEGAKIVVVDIRNGNETLSQIDRAGSEGIYICTDVSSEMDVLYMASIVQSTYRKVDVLFNNAGFRTNASALEETSEQWDRLLGVNLKGMFLMCKHIIPLILKAGGGSIVNTSSVAALLGHPRLVAYTASKGGIISLTKALARDHAKDNIRVNSISPGTIDKPRGIANVALFLASDESALVTGTNIIADGGMHIRGEQSLE